MNALPGRLAGLRVCRDQHGVAEFLNQHFVFVTFNVDVAYGVGSECASGDVTLSFTFDADITRSWHSLLHDVYVSVRPRGVPWTRLLLTRRVPIQRRLIKTTGCKFLRAVLKRDEQTLAYLAAELLLTGQDIARAGSRGERQHQGQQQQRRQPLPERYRMAFDQGWPVLFVPLKIGVAQDRKSTRLNSSHVKI